MSGMDSMNKFLVPRALESLQIDPHWNGNLTILQIRMMAMNTIF